MPPEAALEFNARFSAPLLVSALAKPADVTGPNGKAAEKRYAVYRNNVTVSLINALAATFPAVKRITGEDFFRAMARFHIRQTPPQSPLLFEYGQDFPAFIETYEYASAMPWLADVARIERAWLDVYHSADRLALGAEDFASIAPDMIMDLVLEPHPAVRVLRSHFPAVGIFAMNRSDAPVGHFSSSDPEDALITRPENEVVVRHLPPGGATFFNALIEGQGLGQAASAALAECPDFDLAANLAGLIESGAFQKIVTSR